MRKTPKDKVDKIIELFETTKNNTAPAIAEKLNMNKGTVGGIITKYLNSKKPKTDEL